MRLLTSGLTWRLGRAPQWVTYALLVFGALKRCTKCGEEKPRAEFSRARSRNGRAPWCKACVRRWQQENAEHLADYHRRWQQANRGKKRAQDRRYRDCKRQDPDYWERRRARDRLYRTRKRARLSDTPPEANDG